MTRFIRYSALLAFTLTAYAIEHQQEVFNLVLLPKNDLARELMMRQDFSKREITIDGGRFLLGVTKSEGVNLVGRNKWIAETIGGITLTRVDFHDESLQDCLEFLRRVTAHSLVKMAEQDTHIHFLRLGHTDNSLRITYSAKDVSVRQVLDEIASQQKLQIEIVDYGVILKENEESAPRPKDNKNPF